MSTKTHGQSYTRLFKIWNSMFARCYNPKYRRYYDYGGRGITVCDRWRDYLNFLADMGEPPTPQHQLDRIDNDGNYEPGNCRWATRAEQMRNRRPTVWVTYNGVRMCLAEAAEAAGLYYSLVYRRIKRSGWAVERALTTPAQPRHEASSKYWANIDGKRITLKEAAKSAGLPYDLVYRRVSEGWDITKALSEPPKWAA